MISAVIPKLPFINKDETIDFYNTIGFQLDADYGPYLIFSLEHTELHFFSHDNLNPKKSDFMIYLRVKAEIEKLALVEDTTIIIITNEIGMGVHAETHIGRKFVELQGWVNQFIAKKADKVTFMVSGLPMQVK